MSGAILSAGRPHLFYPSPSGSRNRSIWTRINRFRDNFYPRAARLCPTRGQKVALDSFQFNTFCYFWHILLLYSLHRGVAVHEPHITVRSCRDTTLPSRNTPSSKLHQDFSPFLPVVLIFWRICVIVQLFCVSVVEMKQKKYNRSGLGPEEEVLLSFTSII